MQGFEHAGNNGLGIMASDNVTLNIRAADKEEYERLQAKFIAEQGKVIKAKDFFPVILEVFAKRFPRKRGVK